MIIKHIPEDFYVKEEMELKLGRGDYSYFILEKKNIGTLEAVNLIAGKLGINQKRVGFSGYKDKKAVTEQYISIFKINKDNVGRLNLYGINLTYIGSGNERINAGDLKHNYFRIVVRYLDEKNKLENRKFKNYFDEQRFGINKNNHLIGRAIIKREFDKACNLLKLNVENNNYVGALRTIDKRKLRFYVSAYQSHLFNEVLNKLNK
ncbi:MAG: tRNA pseudouridine(13) synthase TruD, partial [Nanoarchaeota archaeon]